MTEQEYVRMLVDRIVWVKPCECGCGLPAPIAEETNRKLGWVKGQPKRFIHGHSLRPSRPPATHGMTGTVEFNAFHAAKQRCTNPRSPDWKNYGGRGIKFLFRSLSEFLRALGRRPSAEHSLDRANVNGPYAPWNCRWATPVEQANNRRPRESAIEADEVLEIPF
jgi:hypothetical protein